MPWMLAGLVVFLWLAALVIWQVRQRHLHRWLGPYLATWRRRRHVRPNQDVHLLLCIADHFEPKAFKADMETGRRRVETWVRNYPQLVGRFQDSDNRPPRHTFFFPAEEYAPEYLDALSELCRAGFGEVEIHLHHHNDTAQGFRDTLVLFRDQLIHRHGLLSRERHTGAPAYGFIHGNWALCNSRPDGSWCGVDHELTILRETGCFADFTYPSAPDPTQPPIFNSIYYASDRPGQQRSHEVGWPAGSSHPEDALLMIQGPLALDWRQRKWGLLPRLENACLQASQPPSLARVDAWLRARVQVPQRPDWFFVKLHAHGAPEDAHATLLGEPMVQFHEALAQRARENPRFHFHYVTAREMANLVKAAEAGFQGPVAEALDYQWVSNLGEKAELAYSVRRAPCERYTQADTVRASPSSNETFGS